MTKNRPVLLLSSVLAGLQVLAAASSLQGIVGEKPAALIVLGIAMAQAGGGVYLQGISVPQEDVTAYIDAKGTHVAGPAAGITNGVPVQDVKPA